jgi:hypothetical protein
MPTAAGGRAGENALINSVSSTIAHNVVVAMTIDGFCPVRRGPEHPRVAHRRYCYKYCCFMLPFMLGTEIDYTPQTFATTTLIKL